ncbi:MAG: flagellar hook-basal body complex protein FliE [Desulfovibrio sp.]|jgi:flagellar hook-basal body complex protein FliE|nr:flagellar hook-basal body complex protein FliE [Desulfovibrio sp.]
MNVQAIGFKAYAEALRHFDKVDASLRQGTPVGRRSLFAKTLDQSLLRDHVDHSENQGAQADFIKWPTNANTPVLPRNSFGETISTSLNRVNELEQAKSQAVDDFASGRSQNVHELMITMQKSSLAMKLTTAVRGKVLEAYKELSRMQF